MPKKLLLADDSLTIHRVVELTFADEDFEVVSVSNGALAIEKIPAINPDIIIADVNMPERDGYEVCKYVKTNPQFAAIPVLLLKGTFEPFDQVKADQVRADGIIQKPFQSQMLIDQVNKTLGLAPAPPSVQPDTAVPGEIAPQSVSSPPPASVPQVEASPAVPQQPQPQPEIQSEPQMATSPPAPRAVASETPPTPPPFQGSESVGPDSMPQVAEVTPPAVQQPPEYPAANFTPQQETPIFEEDIVTPGPTEPTEFKQAMPPAGEADMGLADIDDTPFGVVPTPEQSKVPENVPPVSTHDGNLEQDASEAGKELSEAFSTGEQVPVQAPPAPAIVGDTTPQPSVQHEPAQQADATPPFEISPPAPEGDAGVPAPDFSDASADISMAFNKLDVAEEAPAEELPPVFQPSAVSEDFVPPVTNGSAEVEKPLSPNQEQTAEESFEAVEPSGEAQVQPESVQSEVYEEKKPEEVKTMPQEEKGASQVPPSSGEEKASDSMADEIADKVLRKLSSEVLKDIAWEVVPEIAEKIVKDTIDKNKSKDKP